MHVSFGGLTIDRNRSVTSVPFLIPATLSGSRVTAVVPKVWGSADLANALTAPGRISTQAYTGDIHHEIKVVKAKPVENDHFNVYAIPTDYAWAQSALATLESAYQRRCTFRRACSIRTAGCGWRKRRRYGSRQSSCRGVVPG